MMTMLKLKAAALAVLAIVVLLGGAMALHESFAGGPVAATLPASRPSPLAQNPQSQPSAPASGPALAGPLEPVSPQQEKQIRAAVYTLAHYHLFAQDNEWPKAIRTLVEIGSPAVPELVAELDRTSNDSTLRAMGFTLRAIGDPRACPALIRAIGRTSVLSSDCGFHIEDKELASFMHKHELNHDPRWTSYGRAIREIAGALEKITDHVEGKPGDIDADSNDPAAMRAAKLRHERLSRQWQVWWDQNQDEFVTAEAMASLTAHPHEESALESAGIEINGPLFPTGQPYHLGPVRDIHLHVWDETFDRTELIDFDAQRKMTLLEAVRLLPPGMRAMEDGVSNWYSSAGADADGYCSLLLLPNHPEKTQGNSDHHVILHFNEKDARSVYSLYGQEDLTWCIEDGRWDSLGAEIESGHPIVLESRGPDDEFIWRDPKTGNRDWEHFPATFLFRTREGGAGIVQLLEPDDKRQSLHLRYRMVEPHPKGYVPRPIPPIPAAAPFGEVKQLTLATPKSGVTCALNLATGVTFAPPKDLADDPTTGPFAFQWFMASPADLMAVEAYQSTKPVGLKFNNTTLVGLSSGAFDRLEPGMVVLALDHLEARPEAFVFRPGDGNDGTATFRTRTGTIGMIQITAASDDPPTVTFRYKLLPSATTPAGEPGH